MNDSRTKHRELPTGWKMARFDEILSKVDRKIILDDSEQYETVGVRWYGQGAFVRERLLGIDIARKQQWIIKSGDVVYNKLFAWKGAFAIADEAVDGRIVSDKFPTYRADLDKVDPRFLSHYFQTPRLAQQSERLSKGAAAISKLTLNPSQFWELAIPLPPLDEQLRIVSQIELLTTKVEEARLLRRSALLESQRLIEAITKGAFIADGDTKVKDFAVLQSGYAFKSEWFTETGIRLVRNVNIGHGRIQWENVARIPEERRAEFGRFELSEGDILISLDRPIISTGVKVARVSKSDLPSLLLQRVGRVIFTSDKLLPDYFFCWLQSPWFVDALDPGRSNGVPHISQKDVENISFAPPPLEEQRQVISHVSSIQKQITQLRQFQSETTAELDALIPSILDKAFKGEL